MKKLTQREHEILKLLVTGLSNNEIAEQLYVSKHTVKAHISAIIEKLNAKNRVNALYIALTNDII